MSNHVDSRMSRRSFMQAAGTSAAALALMGGAGAAIAETSDIQTTYADAIKWDGEYDVVVMGFGGAGAASAIAAADAGASVLLVDRAPKGEEGGNTRYCDQMYIWAENYECADAYYRALAGGFDVPEDLHDAWCKGISTIDDKWVELGANPETITRRDEYGVEFPEFPGSEGIIMKTIGKYDGLSDIWKLYRRNVAERPDSIDVWFESPATKLIQDPATRTVLGATINHLGEDVNIRARNGVVIATGGFENNVDMLRNYLGLDEISPCGTRYNDGSGIRMAQSAGADLWNMHVHEGVGFSGSFGFPIDAEDHGDLYWGMLITHYHIGSQMLVNGKGQRFVNELEYSRHGGISCGYKWTPITHLPDKVYYVFDQAMHDQIWNPAPELLYSWETRQNLVEQRAEEIFCADTVEELAEQIGVDADGLVKTVSEFNDAVQTGEDLRCYRDPQTMRAFDGGPYYACRMVPQMVNTQGGPRRTGKAEVLDIQGNPIPHLYAAGECGHAAVNMYQGGGNMADCLVFGTIAGTNAAEEKDPLPVFAVEEPVASDIRFTIGSGSSEMADTEEFELAENEYLGKGDGMGGALYLAATIEDGQIKAIRILSHHETERIGGTALVTLAEQALANQTYSVDVVTAATMTSAAFMTALSEAMAAAGM